MQLNFQLLAAMVVWKKKDQTGQLSSTPLIHDSRRDFPPILFFSVI